MVGATGINDQKTTVNKMETAKKRKDRGVMVFLALLAVAACIASAYADANETNDTPITIIDSANNTVTLPRAPERIVTVGQQNELFALGLGDKIIGWTPFYRYGYYTDMQDKFDEETDIDLDAIPNIGDPWKKTMNVELIANLSPDIFFTFDKGPYDTYKAQLEALGIPVVYLDYMTEANVPDSTEKLGKIMGVEERGKELADFYREQENKVFDRLEEIDASKPAVYVASGFGAPYTTYGSTYTFGGLATEAGGDDIADNSGITSFGTVTPEFVISQDPDVIVLTGAISSSGTAPPLGYYTTPAETRVALKAKIANLTGWDDLSAMKNKRVFVVSHMLSRNIMDFAAVQYMAKWFYPEEFADLDPEANLREFHQRFMPFTYSGTWGAALYIQGDVNGDDVLGYSDLVAFALSYGTSSGNGKYNSGCDLNDDGRINYNDLIIFAGNYNK